MNTRYQIANTTWQDIVSYPALFKRRILELDRLELAYEDDKWTMLEILSYDPDTKTGDARFVKLKRDVVSKESSTFKYFKSTQSTSLLVGDID